MIIKSFPSGPFVTNAYILACQATKQASIIDPAPESFSLLEEFILKNQLLPQNILLTHSHWDHIGDAATVQEKYSLPLYVHKADANNIITPGSDGLPPMASTKGVEPEDFLTDGQKLSLGELSLEVIHTPGHSPGSICFYLPQENCLISGDTLFQGSIGNLSLPTAEPNRMWDSLKKLEVLPPETKVYPGHGDSTSIGAESWLPRAKEIFGYA